MSKKTKYFTPHQPNTPNWKKKNSNHYVPLLKDVGIRFKQKGVYETDEWYFYPSKAFAMNKKDVSYRLMIEDVLPQIIKYNKQLVKEFVITAIDNNKLVFFGYINRKVSDLSEVAEEIKKEYKSVSSVRFTEVTHTWTY